jgi:NAD(P)-dependent dehydrogenase (short-subunit alcohol dehydrogenase family)
MKPLSGKIAVVAGATRGAGRGIAVMLGEAGATVYCTGRSTRAARVRRARKAPPFELTGRPETIEETAEMVTAYGGIGIPVRVDHTDKAQVKALFARIKRRHKGLDILVNDIWGGDALTQWGTPFWELDLDKGFEMIERAVFSHVITSRYGLPLILPRAKGLVVEITDGNTGDYRGAFFYDFVKTSVIRLAYAMAQELAPHHITALAVTPGFLRSEAMLEYFGVTEANWQDGTKKDPHFIASETPYFVGRAVAALAADPNVFSKTGKALSSWDLSDEYGFTDIDGRQPHWGNYYREHVLGQGGTG